MSWAAGDRGPTPTSGGSSAATASSPDDRGLWVFVAQRRYGFEAAVARRLAFVRWLYRSGRLAPAEGTPPRLVDQAPACPPR